MGRDGHPWGVDVLGQPGELSDQRADELHGEGEQRHQQLCKHGRQEGEGHDRQRGQVYGGRSVSCVRGVQELLGDLV